ncbi:MAG: MBL fold metallo-hydrolase [Xanthomonadales bacterium]|nr:MBL fold metallo-hydrolase [Xanthomonadales bacterium]
MSRIELIIKKPSLIKHQLKRQHIHWLAGLMLFSVNLLADQSIADQYPDSLLYSKPVEVIPHVWSAIGATSAPNYANAGHNNNLSFIVTTDGVVVMNSGATYLLAKALHDEIRKITEQPVRYVFVENAQGHAMLGNGYWKEQGATIIAHTTAAEAFSKSGAAALQSTLRINKEQGKGTSVVLPTETFSDSKVLELGGLRIEAHWLGLAHSRGDIVLWLPAQRLVISGDMAFHERLLPVFPYTDTAAWLESWERFEALAALYVIPGHGHPTNMAQVRRYTHDYLRFLRAAISALLEDGEDLQAAYELDQSQFSHLHTFKLLAAKNAGRVFEQMEFE